MDLTTFAMKERMRIILVTDLITGKHEAFTSIPKVLTKHKTFVSRTMGEAFRNGKPYIKGAFKAERLDVL